MRLDEWMFLKDQPYGVVNVGVALGRVKPLRTLTLPCQKTNPDGVICGGGRGRAELRINNRNYGIVIVRFDGIFCRLKDVSFDYND